MVTTVKPLVVVIVVAYNSPKDVKRCLTSLQAARLTTIVVDNSTNKEARRLTAAICRRYRRVYYRPERHNSGFAKGVNKGVAFAAKLKADYYFLLNVDATVERETIPKLIAAQRASGAAAAGPLIVYGDDSKTAWFAGGESRPWLGIVRHPGRNRPVSKDNRRPVTFLNGCALLIPRESWQRYGSLHADYFMYYEETEWCARVIRKGGQLIYEPAARVLHFTEKSTVKSANARYYLTRNQWHYLKEGLYWYQRLTAIPIIALYQLLTLIKNILRPAQRQAILAAWRDVIKRHYGPRS